MSIIKEIEEVISNVFKECGYDKKIKLENSSRPDLGQFQVNDCMNLAKEYKKNPREIAEQIKSQLEKDERFTNINIAGPGFINISLIDDY